jgi:FixJ family two-component response regulator
MAKARLLVAVVDDEAPVRKALSRLLLASDFDVETFASGQEFLDALAANRPDCLVLDLHMPFMTGVDVQRKLARAGARLPIVVITAYDDPASRAQCLTVGAAAYLLKPFDDQTLLDAIFKAIREKGVLD